MTQSNIYLKRSAVPFIQLVIFVLSILILFAILPLSTNAAEEEPPTDPMKIKIGFFVSSLHDFSMKNQAYEMITWAWFHFPDPEYKPFKTTEIINAKSYYTDAVFAEKRGDIVWSYGKFHAKMKHKWDIKQYPFDTQKLKILFEDNDLSVENLQYEPDHKGSKVDDELSVAGWEVVDLDVKISDKVYHTATGEPNSNGESTFSRASLEITLKRHGIRLFIDSMIGTYIAFALAFMVFSVPSTIMPGKFAFLTSAIFAEVGNKYIIDSKLPTTTAITLIDKIQWLTFGCIALSAIIAIMVGHSLKTPREKKMVLVNRSVQYGMLIVYVFLNVFWVMECV